jgi:hypothetical protein
VARDAGKLITDGQATITELEMAAKEMGTGRYANIGMQLKIIRDRDGGRAVINKGIAAPIPRDDPRWAEAGEASLEEARRELDRDPQLAAWLAGVA